MKHVIIAHQVSAISECLTKVDITGVKSMFSSSVQEKWASVASRPTGSVDLLIGLDYLSLRDEKI